MIRIEVVYARPDRQWSVELEIDECTSAVDAAEVARNSEPMLWVEDLDVVAFAVWGEEVSGDYKMKDGDRLELLRPLPVDPMEARRRKAAARKD